MPGLTLEQFRDAKLRGFPGRKTAMAFDYEGATPCGNPVNARFGAPSHPFGTDRAAIGPAFHRWCADNLAGGYFVGAAGVSGALVYCQLEKDAGLVRRSSAAPGDAEPKTAHGGR